MKKEKQEDLILYLHDSFSGDTLFVDSEDQLPKDKKRLRACIGFEVNENIIEEKMKETIGNIKTDKTPQLKTINLKETKLFDILIDEQKILEAVRQYHLEKYHKIAEHHDIRFFNVYDMETEMSTFFNYFKLHLQSHINEYIEELAKEAEFEIKNLWFSGLDIRSIEPNEIEEYIIKPARKNIHKRLMVKKPGGSKSLVEDYELDTILFKFDKTVKDIKTLKKIFFKNGQLDIDKYKKANINTQKYLDLIKKHINENPSLIATRACSLALGIYIDPQVLYRKLLARKKYNAQRKLDLAARGLDDSIINESLLANFNPE